MPLVSRWFSSKQQAPKPPTDPAPSKDKRQKLETQWLSSISGRTSHRKDANVLLDTEGTATNIKRSHSNVSGAHLSPKSAEQSIVRKRSFLSRKRSGASLLSNHRTKETSEDEYTMVSVPSPDQVRSKTLAERLQELGTAHSQALIDDDEYRMLRQALFKQNMAEQGQQDAHPLQYGSLRLHSDATLAPRPQSHYPASIVPSTSKTHLDAPSHFKADSSSIYSDTMSVHSMRSSFSAATSLLRPGSMRASKAIRRDWQNLNDLHLKELTNGQDVEEAIRTPALLGTSLLPPLALSPSLLADTEFASTPAMRRDNSSSSAASCHSTSTAGLPSAATRSRALSSAGSHHSHGFETDEDHYGDMTSVELKQEIAKLEAEQKRLLQAFDSLALQSSDSPSDSRSSGSSPSIQFASPLASKTTRTRTATQHSADSARLSVYSFRSPVKNLLQTPSEMHSPASSRSPELAELSFRDLESPGQDAAQREQIQRRKRRVQERYDGRIAYLKVRLKGAELRESLMK